MGGCVSTGNENYVGAVSTAENNATNRQLHRLNRDAGSRKTLLLLGTGESGKSTFFRQLKLVALKISTAEKHELLRIWKDDLIFLIIGFNTMLPRSNIIFMMKDKGNITPEELVPYRPLIFRQILREMTILVTEAQARDWTLDSTKNIVRNHFFIALGVLIGLSNWF